jgi:hypothetical protein
MIRLWCKSCGRRASKFASLAVNKAREEEEGPSGCVCRGEREREVEKRICAGERLGLCPSVRENPGGIR